MPIENIIQPKYIEINDQLRLKAYDGEFYFAYNWYQDIESLELIDGRNFVEPYTYEKLEGMYEYLNQQGELYFIQKNIDGRFISIGDITFWKDDMPIVIAKEYRNLGIGKIVVKKLIERGKELGYKTLKVEEVFHYNIGSQKLFESCGFKKYKIKESGISYKMKI